MVKLVKKILGSVTATVILSMGITAARAEEAPTLKPRLIVSGTAKVRGSKIMLGEMSEIYPGDQSSLELCNKLKGITIGDAPAPMATTQLAGQKILDVIGTAGIDLRSITFSIPPFVTIQRDGRRVANNEVLAAAQDKLKSASTNEMRINDIQWDHDQLIPVGLTTVAVETLGEPAGGKLPLRVSINVDGALESKFLATATIEDWREIPVLNKSIERGMLISDSDVELVRTNLSSLASDTVSSPQELVGHAAKNRLAAGESIRRSMIDIPPTIFKGSKVIARYSKGALVASVEATALEDGIRGNEIKVRNEGSRKLLKAKVIDDKTVEVQ